MHFTDSHTHLFLPQFDNDRDEVIARAIDNNVRHLFIPNIDTDTINDVRTLCNKYPENCFPMMGLHPGSVKADFKSQLETIEKEITKEKVYAVGEVGLDFYWDKTFEQEQIKAFQYQIDMAIRYDFPLVIHVRNSYDKVIEVVEDYSTTKLKGIFHCFTGSIDQAEEIINLGFYLGIGGILTFKNSGLDKTISAVSLDNLVLETDSPYLAPAPYRGKRNESSYIPIIAEKLAEIFNVSSQKVADATNKNIKEIFNLSDDNKKIN